VNLIKEKLHNFLKNFFKINNAQNRFMLGSIYLNEAQKKYNSIKNLQETEYKIFSQSGEDGIIDFLLTKIGILDCKFVEIGVGDYSESNTRYIYEKSFSRGLIIDLEHNLKKKISKNIDLWRGLIDIENVEVDSENINPILSKYDLNGNLDLFSIDIDGIDYWVIEKLKAKISKLFIAEYNPTFGHNLEITVPNIKNFNRFKFHYSGCYYGVSLKALVRLMEVKGYDFLGTNKLNFNAFFVHKEFSHQFEDLKKNLKNLENYTKIKTRDSKDKNKQLDFLEKKEDRLVKIRDLDIVDVSQKINKIYKISEIINSI
jgi:hypothetical protein